MAKKTSKHKAHGKSKKMKDGPPPWEPAADDAINIAGLRIYFLTMERLALLIYRSDPTPDRPRLEGLQKLLGQHVQALRKYAKAHSFNVAGDSGCPGEDERCDDTLCHPPGECCF